MATSMFVACAVLTVCAGLFVAIRWLLSPSRSNHSPNHESAGYVLECTVSHRRLRPASATHGFSYRTLWLLLSLTALESPHRALDVGRGWLFGYGALLGRLTGLRPAAYLDASARSIKEKLLGVLEAQGYPRGILGDAWMLTMPGYLGFEGINPLTTYYCYDPQDRLFAVVLEVHNTFGERHVYVLDADKAERRPTSAGGSRLRWTISKDFHVSPFNDRGGVYCVTISEPSHPPPSHASEKQDRAPPPLPYVSIHLRHQTEPSNPLPPTLTATLSATDSQPLTASSLLRALARQPFVLLSSLLRILYEAWILHYIKRLDVYARPDPKPGRQAWAVDPTSQNARSGLQQDGRGVGWQPPSWFEQYARSLVCDSLVRRSGELRVRVTLVAGDPSEPDIVFAPACEQSGASAENAQLTIWYLSPLFFSTLVMAPSSEHALLLGYHTERTFVPSSVPLFLSVFGTNTQGEPEYSISLPQSLRLCAIPKELFDSPFTIPPTHPLDPPASSRIRWARRATYISAFLALGVVERWVYAFARARFVIGHEPWLRWQRAVASWKPVSDSDLSSSIAEAGTAG